MCMINMEFNGPKTLILNEAKVNKYFLIRCIETNIALLGTPIKFVECNNYFLD